MSLANKGDRCTNFIIDNFIGITAFSVILIILGVVGLILPGSLALLVYVVILFSCYHYYASGEGVTIDKKIRGRRVIHCEASLTFDVILIRSTLRLFPPDALSYLPGTEIGVHDWFRGTAVAKSVVSPVKGQYPRCR